MGKNKIRSKNRVRKEDASISDNSVSSIPSTSTSAYENAIAGSTRSTFYRRHLPAEPFRRKTSMPTTTLLTDATTPNTSSGTSPAPPMSRRKRAREKRDSAISGTREGLKLHSKPNTNSLKQPLWGLKPGGWWPCRALQWTYHFFFALIRIHWTDQQTFQDLVLTLTLIGMVMAGFYVALDFLLRALPGVAAQALPVDGNCSIVYVTVPGPIVTVSLIGASPINPARGTYYFSVVNSTTQWLNSIAPPSRFSTLVTRTADITPIVSSLPAIGMASSGATTASSTQISTTNALSIPGFSTPGLDITFTSSLTSSSILESPAGTSVSESTPLPSSLTLSSVSLPPLGPTSSETSSLPRPINQPQRPYPSYPLSTTVVTISSGLSTTVTTLSTLVLPSTFSMPLSISPSSAVMSSSLPSLNPNIPSSTLEGISSQPVSGSNLPLTSSVLPTLTTSLSDGLATVTTGTTVAESSSVLSSTRSDGFTVSLPRPSSGSSLPTGVLSSASSRLSSSSSLTSSIGSSSVLSSRSLVSSLAVISAISSGSSTPTSSSPALTSSVDSSSVTLSTGSTTWSSSSAMTSAPASILTSSSASSLYSSSAPLTSILIPSISASFATFLPSANSSSSPSTNLTFSSSALTLTTTISPVATSPSPSGLNETSLSLVRAVTKVISFGDAAVSFVFPSPDITTTVSYWTGIYPTVTGPLPSDLQTISLTTRSERQTPLSALPSFEVFSSRSRRFKTVVTTIYEEGDESTAALARRQDIPITEVEPTQTLETTMLATTTVALPDLPGPSSCGESGNFTLTFDDTVVGDDNSILLVANGMTNPYHHLFYANGYTYIPDHWEPYPAISQPNIAMFLPLTGRLLPNTPFAGMMLPGELGAGPRASVDAYWFNAYSAYFGCALSGLEPCTLRVSGYRYDPVLKEEVLVAEQNATIPACWGYVNCQLTQIFFNNQFQALSGIQFNAYTYVLGIPQVHMVDDLQMEWYNNSCSAGILRIGHS